MRYSRAKTRANPAFGRTQRQLIRLVRLTSVVFDNSASMMYYHTEGENMAASKIAITIEKKTLTRLDRLVRERVFPNRSKAIQEALEDKIRRLEKDKLSLECEKLDPQEEKKLAEEGFVLEKDKWPEY